MELISSIELKKVTVLSGLNEIIQWTEANMDIDPTQNSEENFQDINKEFEKDGRSDLSDILGDEKGKFLEYLELQQISEPEIEAVGLLASVTKFLRGLFR